MRQSAYARKYEVISCSAGVYQKKIQGLNLSGRRLKQVGQPGLKEAYPPAVQALAVLLN
jgi:hypothetical protein